MSSSVLSSRIAVPRARKLLLWAPTLVWLCVLASFSTNTFSAAHTGIILRKIVGFVYPGITPHQFEVLHFLVRKSAHFVSYGLLSLFAFFSWRATLPTGDPSHPSKPKPGLPGTLHSHPSKPKPGLPGTPRWTSRWMRLALLLTLLAASLDEIHQTFIYSRTGSVRDVLLDMTGALFFQLAIWLVLRREKRA
ncbi:MAG TPA: VanZ family protein [Candidatus Angelobacter sp.]|nr:VanZ family protein [Candidatus Angelobacter sp.]